MGVLVFMFKVFTMEDFRYDVAVHSILMENLHCQFLLENWKFIQECMAAVRDFNFKCNSVSLHIAEHTWTEKQIERV